MIIHEDKDRERFRENTRGFVRCMKTLHDRFVLDEKQSTDAIAKHLESLVEPDEENRPLFRVVAACSTHLICNLLWDRVDVDGTAVSVDAVAALAAKHLLGLILCDSAEPVLRRIGAEKGVDFYAMGKTRQANISP